MNKRLHWIVWNRTVYMYKNGFGIDNLQWLMCHKTKPDQTEPNQNAKEQRLYRYNRERHPVAWFGHGILFIEQE